MICFIYRNKCHFQRCVFLYKNFARSAAVFLAVLFLLCGCTEVSESAPVPPITETAAEERPYPVTVGSFIFNEQPHTVGSLSPAITEMICELGYSDIITGRSSYCSYPEEITKKTDLGSSANPDADAIIASAPQLLISQSPIAKKDIVSIENAGTRVMIIPAPTSIEELYSCYIDMAAVFGGKISCTEAADAAMKPLTDALRKAENSIGSFIYIMSDDLAAASDHTFAGNFFSCFGTNAAAGTEDMVLTPEELAELDPEWLILPFDLAEEPPEAVTELGAYQNGKVIILDENALERIERPTSRLSGTVLDILEQIEDINNGSDDEAE